jgi:5-formyltetrahydrofolate cyclo-ligase
VAAERLPTLLAPDAWLGLYLPVGSEPDLAPWEPGGLAERRRQRWVTAEPVATAVEDGPAALLPGREARLALPAVLPAGPGEEHGRLVYLPWSPGMPLRPDACGIPAPLPAAGREPVPLSPEDLGLLLVPALAVDRSGVRLGSGGGWYDRLRAEPAWRVIPALAVLPSACVVDRLPRDPWDVPFSGWLNEHGVWPAEPHGF